MLMLSESFILHFTPIRGWIRVSGENRQAHFGAIEGGRRLLRTDVKSADVDDDSRMRELQEEYGAGLMHFVLRLADGHVQTAEDAFQETLIRAWRHLDHIPSVAGDLRSWLFTVARRVVIDQSRRRRVRPSEVEMIGVYGKSAGDDTSGTVVARIIFREAFARLTPSQRALLVHLYLEGRSIDAVAVDLGVPAGTVKSRVHHAVNALRVAVL